MNRDLPPADLGSPRSTTRRTTRLFRGIVAGLVVMMLGFGGPLAHADDLDDKKKKLDQQVAQSKADLRDAHDQATKAAAALESSNKQLADAEQKLDAAEAAQASAAAKDRSAAAELVAAQKKLATAKAEAKKATADVDIWMRTVGRTVVQAQQQRTDLIGLAVLTTSTDMGTLNKRAQWSRTMLDSTQAKLDRLKTLQFAKDAAEQKATEAEAEVKVKREAAQKAYQESQTATAASQDARDGRANAVALNLSAKKDADAEVEAEKNRQSQLRAESASVGKRIQDRIARQKAAKAERAKAEAAKRKAEAEAAAAERRAQAARAAARKTSAAKRARANAAAATAEREAKSKRSAANKSIASNKTSSPDWGSGGLIYPSSGPITSPYGMRYHPVLRYWKLHDGTDFGAGCGTPIRAAAAGVVEEKYFNVGYGNRLILDHGLYNGRYLSTAYNHATRYIVSVGQRVSQGQVIGYIGSTGYSTGCHLHFMTYVNGSVVNPMSLY